MKKILFSSILSLSLLSCSENKPKQTEIVEKAAENTESSFPIKRLSNTQDILEGIYSEQIKNNKDLKELDEKVLSIQQDSREMQNIYKDIITNSEDYYNIAENRAKVIRDSALKKEILSLLQNSSEKFNLKKKKLEELTKQVNLNNYKISSFYNAFKIKKTLPEIEKYQNAHPLKTDSLNNFINKQNQLLNELKNLK
ncbi:hypothetical protein A0O34_19035 [Chryseobacterium glaciei]|uniref:Uncharacterized protein n=1 Tax=Chryseobacterium glaciei TaxID=1685010 RepID=A0A172Y093_9FLAO|nr:hypothetical protein [Chryseobacterium glaciei]ANF52485.1 hypothetical protein A0O34_19035 [Chryseobacterium glaciei]